MPKEREQIRERDIEQYLRKRVEGLGGKAYKFTSPGNNGAPDRLVCLPDGRVVFVELKAPGKKPTALQTARQTEFRRLGFTVFGCVDSKTAVDAVIALIQQRHDKEVVPHEVYPPRLPTVRY